MNRPGGRRTRPKALYRWHRRAGIAAALFLIFLAATGVPLQYSPELGLGSRHVGIEAILDWYGLQAPATVRSAGGVVGVGDAVYLEDGRPVDRLDGFRGAVVVDGLVLAAGADTVLLIDGASGQVVDRFRRGDIRRVGLLGDRVVLDTASGTLAADAALVNWAPLTAAGSVDWAQPLPLVGPRAEPYRRHFRATLLSVERLLQDLHSGRMFGILGVIIVDLASALLMFLALSGLLMWWRTYRR
ncbi:MAG: PepSY-associated TM helix domain-containing protein [Pseudomonadales bacterium]